MEPNTSLPMGPSQEPKPVPTSNERPKRRRIAQPVFSTRFLRPPFRAAHVMVLGFGLLLGTLSQAQSTPTATNTQGWVFFDDQVGRDLNISQDQMQQLREIDTRYRQQYTALGNDPANNPGYRELSERRAAEVRSTMSPEMYTQWNMKYNVPNTIQDNRQGNTIGSTPPPPKQ